MSAQFWVWWGSAAQLIPPNSYFYKDENILMAILLGEKEIDQVSTVAFPPQTSQTVYPSPSQYGHFVPSSIHSKNCREVSVQTSNTVCVQKRKYRYNNGKHKRKTTTIVGHLTCGSMFGSPVPSHSAVKRSSSITKCHQLHEYFTLWAQIHSMRRTTTSIHNPL